MKQLKKTTNPCTFYRVEWQNWRDKVVKEVFWTEAEANFFANHLEHVKGVFCPHVYEITEKLL